MKTTLAVIVLMFAALPCFSQVIDGGVPMAWPITRFDTGQMVAFNFALFAGGSPVPKHTGVTPVFFSWRNGLFDLQTDNGFCHYCEFHGHYDPLQIQWLQGSSDECLIVTFPMHGRLLLNGVLYTNRYSTYSQQACTTDGVLHYDGGSLTVDLTRSAGAR